MKKRAKWGCSRREFLQYSATAGAAAAMQWRSMLMAAPKKALGPYGLISPALTKFKDPIRGIGGTGIPIAATDGVSALTGAQHYSIQIGPFNDVLHSDFMTPGSAAYAGAGFAGTKLWGYGQGGGFKHLGGIVVAARNAATQITFTNNLPNVPIVPPDITLPQPTAQRWDRTAVHLHGGHVHWISDGGPHDWWAPDGVAGDSFVNNILNPAALPGQADYYYPNDQSGRFMWYHDHAWGITRTNAYAGLATGYVLVDPVAELAFDVANPGVPSATDLSIVNSRFFYLIFQDKIFFGPAGPPAFYGANAGPGDLAYATTYDPGLFGPPGVPSFGQPLLSPFPVPSCVPEFFGDTMLVNGTAFPALDVEARPVRIRMLNACSSRFLNPRLVATAGTTFPNNAEPKVKVLGPGFIQIGTEGGYLPQAVPLTGQPGSQLLLAPAERADILIDFSAVAPGTEFILYNDAPGPFPGGSKLFDYYLNASKSPTTAAGFGPNTRTIMKFRVVTPATPVTPLPATITTNVADLSDPLLVAQTPGVPTPIPAQVTVGGISYPVATVRTLTLNEGFDEYGRLAQFLGSNTTPPGAVPGFFGLNYMDPPTEIAANGSVEVWQIANLTADTHPIHFHLSNVQILYRQPINMKGLTGTFVVTPIGPAIAPDLNELGYKETVRMNPGEVTTVIMKFDLPPNPPNVNVPLSPRSGIVGHEYVWHCHILEHEEHDMMRPLIITP